MRRSPASSAWVLTSFDVASVGEESRRGLVWAFGVVASGGGMLALLRWCEGMDHFVVVFSSTRAPSSEHARLLVAYMVNMGLLGCCFRRYGRFLRWLR